MRINKAQFGGGITSECYDKFIQQLEAHLLAGNTVVLKNIGTLKTTVVPAKHKSVGGNLLYLEQTRKIKFAQSRNFVGLTTMDNLVEQLINQPKTVEHGN